jgi:phage FluMu protein Com
MMTIRVNKVECDRCERLFHEVEGHELDKCPHCGGVFSPDNRANVAGTRFVKVGVDPKTGKLSIENVRMVEVFPV